MQEGLENLMSCPECRGDLTTLKIIDFIELNHIRFMCSGLLQCNQCSSIYPVIDRIPRLLKSNELMTTEIDKTKNFLKCSNQEPKRQEIQQISDEEKYKTITKLVKEKYAFDEIQSIKTIERIETDICYRVYETEKKERFLMTCKPYLLKKPRILADIGGGQGGTLTCLSRHFQPEMTILIDIDLQWAHVALVRNPLTNVIRADATNLPLKDQSIDFTITTSVLEHIKRWETAIKEIARVSRNAMICYGPNKLFPYDAGHLKAPLVTILPKTVGAYVAFLFHKLKGSGLSYKSLKNQINNMNYISRRKVERVLLRYGRVNNLFQEFVYHSIFSDSSYHFHGRLKSFLKTHHFTIKLFSKSMVLMGIEPQVYLFFKKKSER